MIQIWNVAPWDKALCFVGNLIIISLVAISCERKTGKTAKLGLWGNKGSWEQGNVALFNVGVLWMFVWTFVMWVGSHVLVVFLISFTVIPHQRPPNLLSVQFLENWPSFLMIVCPWACVRVAFIQLLNYACPHFQTRVLKRNFSPKKACLWLQVKYFLLNPSWWWTKTYRCFGEILMCSLVAFWVCSDLTVCLWCLLISGVLVSSNAFTLLTENVDNFFLKYILVHLKKN